MKSLINRTALHVIKDVLNSMPIKGYTSVTIKDETYQLIKKYAQNESKTPAKLIEKLLETYEPPQPPAPLLGQEVKPIQAEWQWPGPYLQVIMDKKVKHYKSTAWIRTGEYIPKVGAPQYGRTFMERIRREEDFSVEKLFVVSKNAWDDIQVWDWISMWLTLHFTYKEKVEIFIVKEKTAFDEGIDKLYFDMGIYSKGLFGYLDIGEDSSVGKYTWDFNEQKVSEADNTFEKLKKLAISQTVIYERISKLST